MSELIKNENDFINKLADITGTTDINFGLISEESKNNIEKFDIESILVRSLCGADEYSNNGRLYSRPGQTLMIFNDIYGREATYNVPLDIV